MDHSAEEVGVISSRVNSSFQVSQHPGPYQLVLLPARLALLLGQLCHFLLHVPYLPLHSLILVFLPVFGSDALVSLLRHLLQVLL